MIEGTHHYRPRDRIVEKIECYIIENGLKTGDKLPSERVLCEMWDCNHITLRAAIKRLAIEGKIISEQSVGSFVADEKMERYLQDFYSFSEFAARQGKTMQNKLISLQEIKASKKLSEKLQIAAGNTALEIVRLRIVEAMPIAIENAYLSLDRFSELIKYDFSKHSLYSILEEEYGLEMEGGEEEIGITNATETEAALLEMQHNSPLFLLKQLTWDKEKRPVEYVRSVVRPDKIRFASVLKKENGMKG